MAAYSNHSALKKSSPTCVSETRPIAKLSELSKVLERLVHAQLSEHLDRHSLLEPRLAGFTPYHSPQSALLGVIDDVRRAMDERKLTILLLFDFSKVFDVFPHDELIAKLRRLNLTGIALK